jgi:CRISPR/Cas system endoribonuclease Cas6 (RAMP superfamily)
MRTTLTLDPDVAQTLKSRLSESKATLKEIVNDALRRGLSVESQRPKKPFRVTSYSLGFRPGIDTDKLGQLADELETQAFAAKAARGNKRR